MLLIRLAQAQVVFQVNQASGAKPVLDQAFFEHSVPNSDTTDLMSKILMSK